MPRGRPSGKTTSKTAAKSSPNATKSAVRKSGMRKKRTASSLLPPAPAPTSTRKAPKYQDFNPNAIRSYQELILALESSCAQLTLADNIIVKDDILINHDIAINFNGFSLISEDSRSGARVLDIRSGEVSLIGQGKVFAMGPRSVAIRVFGAISSGVPNYTTLTIDEGISLFAPDSYGILISPNLGVAYGLTINYSGQIFARDGICLSSGVHGHDANLPVINLKSSARITADELSGTAIEAAGHGVWDISTAKVYGATGASLSSGILRFQHAQIISSGPVFCLIESTTKDLEVTIDGGNYISANSSIIAGATASLKTFLAKGGAEFCSSVDHIPPEIKPKLTLRKSLIFRDDVEEFISSLTPPETIAQPDTVELQSIPDESQITPESSVMSPSVLPEQPKAPSNPEPRPIIPAELTDDATDEREIVLELTAEKISRPITPVLAAPPKPAQPITGEQEAARLALSDAISDIRRLSADDYDVGFAQLEQAIQKSEKILKNPLASLTDISDAANDLLRAFDGLEEKDEFSMSDEELDDLFYHGAVLGELTTEIERVKQEKRTKHLSKKPSHDPKDILKEAQAEVGFTPVMKSSRPQTVQPPVHLATSQPIVPATNFDALSDALSTIADLNLNEYSQASQQSLLSHLALAQEVLSNASSTQDSIDQITASLLADMTSLERTQPAIRQHSQYQAQLSSPAPIIKRLIPPTMIDEMSPNSIWSQGITMIDEMSPHIITAPAREKILRAIQPHLRAIVRIITSPVRKTSRSLSAGLRAGIRAYRETLHSAKN